MFRQEAIFPVERLNPAASYITTRVYARAIANSMESSPVIIATEAETAVTETTDEATEAETEEATDSEMSITEEASIEEGESATEETSVQGEITLSENLEDYTFSFDGVVYQLPCDYSLFKQNGWTIYDGSDKSESTELVGTSYDWFYLTNGDTKVDIYLYNPSGNVQEAKDCKVGKIEVSKHDEIDFSVAKGITFDSSVDEIKDAFGTPSDTYSGDSYQSLTYESDSDNYYEEVKFYVYDDTSYNYITLENMVLSGEETEVSQDVPEYLSSYVAPTELPSDTEQPVFELDGKLYRLPCPLTEFTDDGWEIESVDVKTINAGNYDYSALSIKKGDVELSLGMYNFAKVAVSTENAAVYKIDFQHSEYSSGSVYGIPEDILKASGGLTLKSTADEIKATVSSNFDEYISDSSDYKSYDYYKDNVSIKYTISSSDSYTSKSIDIKNGNWDY